MTGVEPRIWVYRVKNLLRTVDGDTYDLTVSRRMDFGFYLIEEKEWSTRFRMLGGDAWEKNEAGGAAATAYSKNWIDQQLEIDVLVGQTFKADNFGRWLIDLYRADTGEHLVDQLRAEGLLKKSRWDPAAVAHHERRWAA